MTVLPVTSDLLEVEEVPQNLIVRVKMIPTKITSIILKAYEVDQFIWHSSSQLVVPQTEVFEVREIP